MKRIKHKIVIIFFSAIIIAANAANAEIVIDDLVEPMAPTVSISVPTPDDNPDDIPKLNPGSQDVIEFVNKDKLHGTLVSVNPKDYGLKWKHINANNVIDFSLPCVSRLTLAERSGSKAQPANSVVRLTNGDMFYGNIVSLDENTLIFNTWYSGRIEIKRVKDPSGNFRNVPEYEVCKKIALEKNIPLKIVYDTISREAADD